MIKEYKDGVKIATTLIFEEIIKGTDKHFIDGMLYFARSYGAITEEERSALIQHLEERG